jgi:hypothetical protein
MTEREFDFPPFNSAAAFRPGDKVRDLCWGGGYRGTVTRVDNDAVFVTWHGHFADHEMRHDQIRNDEEDNR